MAKTYCLKFCAECQMKEQLNCPGCYQGPGERFKGDCALKKCCVGRGHETCETCNQNSYCGLFRGRERMPEQRLKAMEADADMPLGKLKVDGGASANNYLTQTQADISAAPVLRPRCVETTAMGAAYLAGLAVGYWKNMDEIRKNWSVDRLFQPQISSVERLERTKGWKKAVSCTLGWAK